MTDTLTPNPHRLQRHWFYGLLLALLAALYTPLLWHWIDGWLNKSISIEHEYFSHALIGLPYAAYLTWDYRKKWHALPAVTHPAGLGLLGLGALLYLFGTGEMIGWSLPIVLTGLCLSLKGVPGLKLQAFPLLFVWFATPNAIPYLLSSSTLPLQTLIAGTAGFILQVLGVPDVSVSGIYITVQDHLVEVAPYCAGLKMLFTSLYIGGILLHWTGTWRSRPKVLSFFAGTIVISVLINILRNTILTYLYGMGHYNAFDWTHEGLGGDLISLVMLLLVIVWLDGIERITNYYQQGNGGGIINYGGLLPGQSDRSGRS
ncbi:cyanoexosortase B [Spirulina major]|uniref:cyanoexosortase B n=1 Tax=Spirulina major TaxID=270636 RepID=UPI0009343FD4|nr:cyanoexosortase B [Spirulina major]